jgi:hypothetical protein
MQELVEMIRRDHAALAGLAAKGDPDRFDEVLDAHRALLVGTVAPLTATLGDGAVAEWEDARRSLDDAGGGDVDALRAHAEQMEQIVLPRLLSELDEGDLGEATLEVMRHHEALGLGSSRPSAMRSDLDEDAGDTSRPAGA